MSLNYYLGSLQSRREAGILNRWPAIGPVVYIKNQMNISHEDLTELTEIIEDTTEYFCDQHLVSGELVWNVVLALSMAKLEELKGNIVADEEVAA